MTINMNNPQPNYKMYIVFVFTQLVIEPTFVWSSTL